MKPPANTTMPPCPYCGYWTTRVIFTRKDPDAITIRRRQCKRCDFRFYTTQVLAPPEVVVDKKNLKFRRDAYGDEYMIIADSQ